MAGLLGDLRTAPVCERVLCEADGTLSAIRILHGGEVQAVGDGVGPLRLSLLLMLVRGNALPGPHTLLLNTQLPSGQVVGHKQLALELAGGTEQANSLVLELSFVPGAEGLYWFRLAWDSDAAQLTRVPFTVVLVRPCSKEGHTHASR